jgi:hypothetical protein
VRRRYLVRFCGIHMDHAETRISALMHPLPDLLGDPIGLLDRESTWDHNRHPGVHRVGPDVLVAEIVDVQDTLSRDSFIATLRIAGHSLLVDVRSAC